MAGLITFFIVIKVKAKVKVKIKITIKVKIKVILKTRLPLQRHRRPTQEIIVTKDEQDRDIESWPYKIINELSTDE